MNLQFTANLIMYADLQKYRYANYLYICYAYFINNEEWVLR